MKVGSRVESRMHLGDIPGRFRRGRVTNIQERHVTVRWDDGTEWRERIGNIRLMKPNRFNFVIFKNYDGSVEGKRIPRETYERIMDSDSGDVQI